MKRILFLSAALLWLASCQREPVYIGDLLLEDPNDTITNPIDTTNQNIHPCDPDSVYFERDLLPILVSNCAMSGCHDPASHQDGVILSSYNSVMQTADIKISDPADSKIYEVLFETGDDRMPPPPADPLTAEQKALILKWIQQGAQNLFCDECDTTNVTFAATIAPIIQNKCRGCHGNTNPSGGIKLTNYSEIQAIATNGLLWGTVNHEAGYKPMPQGGPKLPDCDLQQIRIWIDDGTPNN